MITAKNLLAYSSKFKKEVPGHDGKYEYTSEILLNDSIVHAAIITANLFEKAITEPMKTVNMYCGEFSLFREKAQYAIDKVLSDCDKAGLSVSEEEAWKNFKPGQELLDNFTEFLKNGGTLNLIIERGDDTLKSCEIWKTLRDYIRNGQVHLSVIRESMGLGHFTATADAYRIEKSDNTKTAIGCFNDPENAEVLNENFMFLQKISDPIAV